MSYSEVAKVRSDSEGDLGFVDVMTNEEARMIVSIEQYRVFWDCCDAQVCHRILSYTQLCPFASKGDCPFGEQ